MTSKQGEAWRALAEAREKLLDKIVREREVDIDPYLEELAAIKKAKRRVSRLRK